LFANGDANILLASPTNFSTSPTNYTWNFTNAQVMTLRNFIASGGDVAIGLDPDCHFFLSGITLNLTTGPVPAVPEPASLTLMGLGLAGWYRRRRALAARA
jgi:PEP-CTERM motif